jgi:hypothetical protein
MSCALPRLPHILLASSIALAALGAAPALSKLASPKPGDIKGESMDDKHKDTIELAPVRCDTRHGGMMNGVSSDPEEGGQVSAAKGDGTVGTAGTTTGYDLKANVKARAGGGSSDPEEGGEVMAKRAGGKVHVSDMQVTKHFDQSSNNLMMKSTGSGSDCGSGQH